MLVVDEVSVVVTLVDAGVVLEDLVVVELSVLLDSLVVLASELDSELEDVALADIVEAFAFVAVPLTKLTLDVAYASVPHIQLARSPWKACAMIVPGLTPSVWQALWIVETSEFSSVWHAFGQLAYAPKGANRALSQLKIGVL